MWFKKKSVLQADHHYDTEKSFDGTDWRTTSKRQFWSASQTLPSAADANKYFYLPALGNYFTGQLSNVGILGNYWSSSADPWDSDKGKAYGLSFLSGIVVVGIDLRFYGAWVGGLE